MSSRLFQEVREKRGLVYAISSFLSPYLDGGTFGIYAGTGEAEAAELVPVVLAELAAVQQAVTEEELARAKAQVKASLLMSLESTSSRCEQIAHQIHTWGRVVPMEETLAKLAAVTRADVAAAARTIFRATPTLAAVGPVSKLPALPAIAEKLAA
jgi:predicted Zn-dependent peptidase